MVVNNVLCMGGSITKSPGYIILKRATGEERGPRVLVADRKGKRACLFSLPNGAGPDGSMGKKLDMMPSGWKKCCAKKIADIDALAV